MVGRMFCCPIWNLAQVLCKMSTLAHFPVELVCEDYSYIGKKTVKEFEFRLLFLQFLQVPDAWIMTILVALNYRLCPASNHKSWCQAVALLLTISLPGRMLASKHIHLLFSHHVSFGFWTAILLDNTVWNAANKKIDCSLSDFHTYIGTAAHATLEMEQLSSHEICHCGYCYLYAGLW